MNYSAILLTIGLLVAACDESSAKGNKLHDDMQKDCKNQVIFQIGKIEYKIDPKYHVFFDWKDSDGNSHDINELEGVREECVDIDLGEISYFMTSGQTGLAIISGNEPIETTYQRHKDVIEESHQNGSFEVLQSGIEKYYDKTEILYLLPPEKTSTANGEPIVIECPDGQKIRVSDYSRCRIIFMHPDGNFIGETLTRKFFPEERIMDGYYRTIDYYKTYKLNY